MIDLAGLLGEGGTPVWAVLATGTLGLAMALALGALSAARARVPIGLWLLPPFLALAAGSWFTLEASQVALAEVGAAGAGAEALAAAADSAARRPRILGGLVAVPLFVLTAWLAALSSLARGGERRVWTLGQGGVVLLLGAACALFAPVVPLLRAGPFLEYVGPGPAVLAVLALGTGPALGVAAAHTSTAAVDAPRLAGARGVTLAAVLGAVGVGGWMLADMAAVHMVAANASASPEVRVLEATHAAAAARVLGEATAAIALGMALVGGMSLLLVGGHLAERRSVLGGLSLGLLLPAIGVIGSEIALSEPLRERSADRRPLMAWAGKTPGLPATARPSTARAQGLCLIRRRGSSWAAVQRYRSWPSPDCGPEEAELVLPLEGDAAVIAVPGDVAIGRLTNTQWFLEAGTLSIVLQPTHDVPAEELALLGEPDLALVIPWHGPGPGEGDAVAEIRPSGLSHVPEDGGPVFVIADPRMNAQDLVDACATARCVLTPSR